MKTRTDLAGYLEEVTGQAAAIQDAAPGAESELPLFLRSAYRLIEASLLGHRFVLAAEQEVRDQATPGEYARHMDLLRAAMGTDVALVLPRIPTHVRNRLVQRGVPFIVPGRQMFLPFLAVDLRERDHRPFRGQREALTAAAQAVLLGHLLGKSMQDRPLGELAVMLGYSPMTLSKVADELEAKGLCEVVREGKTRRLGFLDAGRTLWERALPILANPVRARQWVRRWEPGRAGKVAAGLTALERYGSIADDRIPTFALWRNDVRTGLERGDIVACDVPDDAAAAIECWTYDPARLADGDCVDRLSLYLSLRNAPDERVQKELRALLEDVGW